MERHKPYPHVIEEIEDWPIYKLYQDREGFVNEIIEFTLERFSKKSNEEINNIIARSIYLERARIKREPWKVDRADEKDFWKWVRKKLIKKSLDKDDAEVKENNERILREIITRYAEEIAGGFKKSTFLFARKFLLAFFNRLLNTAAARNLRRLYSTKYRLVERLRVYGDIHNIRSLATKGTLVLVPTHFSNLDSIIIGYALDSAVGLPTFSYGAGLNLYNTGYTAYYMNRLGAYRIDRRKKNPIYLETLKAMSNLSIQRGTNTLFFPGGTRSRAGSIETKLKMGLLGTAVEAQRHIFEQGREDKIYVVPLVLGYQFVLEAPSLIDQYLKKEGEEMYLKNTKDESFSFRKISKFMWQLFSKRSDITFSLGKPMDVLGNFVTEDGLSVDKYGHAIDVKEYFMKNGKIDPNTQRESQYTRRLSQIIVDRFFKENIVLSGHLVTYVAFNLIQKQNPNLDIYGLLRLPPEDYVIPFKTFCEAVDALRQRLFQMEKEGNVQLAEKLYEPIEKLVKDGIINAGIYHSKEPLKRNKNGDVISEDLKLLYYYHNRLEHYDLARHVDWTNYRIKYTDETQSQVEKEKVVLENESI